MHVSIHRGFIFNGLSIYRRSNSYSKREGGCIKAIFGSTGSGKYTIHFSNILRYLVEFHIGAKEERVFRMHFTEHK